MKRMLLIVISLNTLVVSGCAFTRTEKTVNYVPNIRAASLDSLSTKSLIVGQVKDARGVPDPTIIFYKKNLHGDTTSGSYAADKPIAEILRTGLIQSLESKRFRINKGTMRVRQS